MASASFIPSFGGRSGERVQDLIDDVELEVARLRIAEDDPKWDQMARAVCRRSLMGRAQTWFRSLPVARRDTWASLKAELTTKWEAEEIAQNEKWRAAAMRFRRRDGETLKQLIKRADRIDKHLNNADDSNISNILAICFLKTMVTGEKDTMLRSCVGLVLSCSGHTEEGYLKPTVTYGDVRAVVKEVAHTMNQDLDLSESDSDVDNNEVLTSQAIAKAVKDGVSAALREHMSRRTLERNDCLNA